LSDSSSGFETEGALEVDDLEEEVEEVDGGFIFDFLGDILLF
jgi:hypothetical protein